MLIGLVAALLGGVGAAGVREAADRTVRGTRELMRATRVPVLAIIPAIASAAALRRRSMRHRLIVVGTLTSIVLMAAWFHFFVMPLEVAWFGLERRLAF